MHVIGHIKLCDNMSLKYSVFKYVFGCKNYFIWLYNQCSNTKWMQLESVIQTCIINAM